MTPEDEANSKGSGSAATISFPTTVSAGAKIICAIGGDEEVAIGCTFPEGWSILRNPADDTDAEYGGGGVCSATAWQYTAAGTEGGGTFEVTLGESGTWVAKVWSFAGAGSGAEAEGTGSGGGNQPNPPSITPSWGAKTGAAILAFYGADSGNALASAYPTGYTGTGTDDTSFGGDCGAGWARSTFNGASEDPDPFTMASSQGHAELSIAVEPPAAQSPLLLLLLNQ